MIATSAQLPLSRSHATELLDQQLWCWGQDVVHDSGNLLVEYGCTRVAPARDAEGGGQASPRRASGSRVSPRARRPGMSVTPATPSLYCHGIASRGEVILRGFGVLHGVSSRGWIYLTRYRFNPLYYPEPTLPRPPWTDHDLPRFRRPTADERPASLELLGELLNWIASYESWIQARFGPDYRREVLRAWQQRKRRDNSLGVDRASEWLTIRDVVLRHPDTWLGRH